MRPSPELEKLYMELRDAALRQVDAYERTLGLPLTAELRERVKILHQRVKELELENLRLKSGKFVVQ